jgi:hypothetical protein
MLSKTVDHNLTLYSTAAMAAGVSMLALAQPAEAKVVVTQKHISIPIGQPVSIDLNQDGIADFQFNLMSSDADCSPEYDFTLKPLTGGAVVGSPIRSYAPYASTLRQGAKIGPSAHFSASAGDGVTIENSFFAYCSNSYHRSLLGHWGGNPQNRYLGVKFLTNGTTHYGWIRLASNFVNRKAISAHIIAYAYETVANKKISAGATSSSAIQAEAQQDMKSGRPSLGMLALGADGLALWRREEALSA